MNRINKLTPKLRKSPQPPLSYAGATAEADRAKGPPLDQPPAPHSELNPGDRVMGLGDFGKPTGGFGTVVRTNEDDALVKWDDDGRMRLRQPWLEKSATRFIPSQASHRRAASRCFARANRFTAERTHCSDLGRRPYSLNIDSNESSLMWLAGAIQ